MSEVIEKKKIVPTEQILIALREKPLTVEQITQALKDDEKAGVHTAIDSLEESGRICRDIEGRYHTSRKGRIEADQAVVHALLVAGGPRTIQQLMTDLKSERGVIEYACGLLVAHKLIRPTFDKDSGVVFEPI